MSYPYSYGRGECEVCSHYFTDGVSDGVCANCREAYPDDYPTDDAEVIAKRALFSAAKEAALMQRMLNESPQGDDL